MSLEQAIAELNETVKALTEVFKANGAAQVVIGSDNLKKAAEAKKPEPAASKKAETAPAAKGPASTKAKPDAATSTLTYDDIKTPFLSLAKLDLATAQGVLAEFDLGASLKTAKPEQYEAIAARLGELLNDLA